MKKNNQGQSLFEVILAIGVVTTVLVALIGLVAVVQKNTTSSRNRANATRFVQELAEWMRGQRDGGWTQFVANTGNSTKCFDSLSWTNNNACGSNEYIVDTPFVRQAVFTQVSVNTVRAELSVVWVDGQITHDIRTTTYFTNWRKN